MTRPDAGDSRLVAIDWMRGFVMVLMAVDHGSAVVIRAHGVKPEVFDAAQARELEIIDGTCSWVIQEQRAIQQLVEV